MVMIFLSACGSPNINDLKAFIATTQAGPKGRIEPLPEPKPYIIYEYQSSNLRDPFAVEMTAEESHNFDERLAPDPDRPKEPLEEYPLDALRLVGSMERDGIMWALISDSDGILHRLKEGNYLGQNFGRITAVTEGEVTVIEKYIDGNRGWKERTVSLAMSDE